MTNPGKVQGGPNDVLEGADLFIGLSGPGLVEAKSLASMNDDAIVFAMANPTPEVMPEDAEPYVRIMATESLRLPEPDQQRARLPWDLPAARSTPAPPRSPRR